jgi:hypothetical protein
VASLSACTHALRTDLFIALDYPLHESHWPGYRRIVEYIRQIDGFASVTVIQRTENYGARRNYMDMRRQVFDAYDRVIMCEDDNEMSPCFLDYVNQGLQRFEKHVDVMAVCGYHFPVPAPTTTDHYLHRGFCAWGFGEWRNRPLPMFYPHREVVTLSRDVALMRRMLVRSSSFFAQFVQTLLSGRDAYGDTAIGIELSRNPKLRCVFPCVSKVRNHGHDGSGVHCAYAPHAVFPVQDIDASREFIFRDAAAMDGSAFERALRQYVSVRSSTLVKVILMYLAFRAGIYQRDRGTKGEGSC